MVFAECEYDEHFLYVHLYDCFPDKRGTEERPEWYEEVTTRDTSKVKQGIRDLKIRSHYHNLWLK